MNQITEYFVTLNTTGRDHKIPLKDVNALIAGKSIIIQVDGSWMSKIKLIHIDKIIVRTVTEEVMSVDSLKALVTGSIN